MRGASARWLCGGFCGVTPGAPAADTCHLRFGLVSKAHHTRAVNLRTSLQNVSPKSTRMIGVSYCERFPTTCGEPRVGRLVVVFLGIRLIFFDKNSLPWYSMPESISISRVVIDIACGTTLRSYVPR